MLDAFKSKLMGQEPSSPEEPAAAAAVAGKHFSPQTPRAHRLSMDYGTLSEVQKRAMLKEGISTTYDIDNLISWKVFGIFQGTILQNRSLWKETGMNAVLYWSVVICFATVRWKNFSEFVGEESTIRAFIAMFSTLIGLLLSFYTALNLSRWWHMREGVQMIQEGCKKLTMMIFSGVTSDLTLQNTIHRYARASLFMIFAASNHAEGDAPPRRKAVAKELLTEEEVEKLEQCNPHATFVHCETLWVWLAHAVTSLHEQGLTKGPPHYCALMAAVEQGRSGVAHIQSYLETPIPMGYVHLLCLMVKLHNIIVTVLMAMATVKLSGGRLGFQAVGVFRTSFRAFFMPFLYNAILILNSEVHDPFGCDAADFDFNASDVNMLMSTKSYHKANATVPGCILNRVYQPVDKPAEAPGHETP